MSNTLGPLTPTSLSAGENHSLAPAAMDGTMDGHSIHEELPSPHLAIHQQAIPEHSDVSVAVVHPTENFLSLDYLQTKVSQSKEAGLSHGGSVKDFMTHYSWSKALQCMKATQQDGALYAAPFNSKEAIFVSQSPLWKEPAHLFAEGAFCYEKNHEDSGDAFKNAGKARIREINNTLTPAEMEKIADGLPTTSDLYAESGKYYKMSEEDQTGQRNIQQKIASCLEEAATKLQENDAHSANRYTEAAMCFKTSLTTKDQVMASRWNDAGVAMKQSALQPAGSEERSLYQMASDFFKAAATAKGPEKENAVKNANLCMQAATETNPAMRKTLVESIAVLPSTELSSASTPPQQRPGRSLFNRIFG